MEHRCTALVAYYWSLRAGSVGLKNEQHGQLHSGMLILYLSQATNKHFNGEAKIFFLQGCIQFDLLLLLIFISLKKKAAFVPNSIKSIFSTLRKFRNRFFFLVKKKRRSFDKIFIPSISHSCFLVA